MNGEQQQVWRVFLAGDSTVQSYREEADRPLAGWGQKIGDYFNENVQFFNHAMGGRSSKSFISEGRLEVILQQLQAGDYLFIQFAHNDEKSEDERRYTEPYTSYQECLRVYVNEARNRGAIPVLISPVERMKFNEAGRIDRSHGEYPAAMEQLAQEMDVLYIDLHRKSIRLFQQMGEEALKRTFLWLKPGEYAAYPDGIEDRTHFCLEGAYQIAGLVVEGIQELDLPFRHGLVK